MLGKRALLKAWCKHIHSLSEEVSEICIYRKYSTADKRQPEDVVLGKELQKVRVANQSLVWSGVQDRGKVLCRADKASEETLAGCNGCLT